MKKLRIEFIVPSGVNPLDIASILEKCQDYGIDSKQVLSLSELAVVDEKYDYKLTIIIPSKKKNKEL